jgi:hypothetical protein
MSRSLMPPSFLPAGVLDIGGRDIDGLFKEGERNPPAGTRLGMPFRGAEINQSGDYCLIINSIHFYLLGMASLMLSLVKMCQLSRHSDQLTIINQLVLLLVIK